MPSTVYFSPARGKARRNKFDRLTQLFDRGGGPGLFGPGQLVAVKVHWGELGNADFIPSFYVKHFVSLLQHRGAKPFVTDTNTLYRGSRHHAVDGIATAAANGFSLATLGVPVIVADGIRGFDYRDVPIAGKHVKTARIAGAIADCDGILAISHVKGHMVFGFGGAVKNIGMGCAAAAAKQSLHADVRPRVSEDDCTGCGDCAANCRFHAIDLGPRARIDPARCEGCGECVVVCPQEAIPIHWEGDTSVTQEKTAEYAAAALAGKKALYVNFLTSITPDCDCMDWSDAPIVPDIGYLASTDPVAIDLASVDLVNGFTGFADRFPVPLAGDRFRALHGIDYLPLFEHAESLGLGSRSYTLVRLD
jgi:uncharacterized Fe-S center protein